ncbi:uncharacterized protein LOC130992296 [Salvia miltiorrhiza]|uniref:uncharacterized protein LOC130992296 n=1 Tax=Salvia miltiorrhiza TaxID=226208 RepID=UPI0025AC4B81|nr:uncharacterized protein LOC130992296 [Salvia miltiorrhiza]
MSPTLTSQGLVLATAMAVSAATAVLFDLLREKYFPSTSLILPNHQIHQQQLLKSCISSGSRKSEKEAKKKKVKFAEDVKEPKGNGELYRKAGRKKTEILKKSCCGNELPANHAALYNGILKGRAHGMGYSY